MQVYVPGDQVRVTRGKWENTTATVIAASGEFVHVAGVFDGPSIESKSIHQNWLERAGSQEEVATASVEASTFGHHQVVAITNGKYRGLNAKVLEDLGGPEVRLSIEDLDRCLDDWVDRGALQPTNARCRCPVE